MRIRWSDADDGSSPLDWRIPSAILATLFLNFFFWFAYGLDLQVFGSFAADAAAADGLALAIVVLFFLGPARASQAAGRPLLETIDRSFGTIPAVCVRLGCVAFLITWIAAMISLETRISGSAFQSGLSRRESIWLGAVLLLYLLATSIQGVRTTAKLATLTNHLAIAMLLAAAIRVRQGSYAIFDVTAASNLRSIWYGLSTTFDYAAPLAFLAAGFAFRLKGKRSLTKVAALGLVLPLGGALSMTLLIGIMTHASSFYTPSLPPAVMMALWSKTPLSYARPAHLLAVVTAFGAIRIGFRWLRECVLIMVPTRWVTVSLLICAAAAIGLTLKQEWDRIPFEMPAIWLAATAAVMTADATIARRRTASARMVDWVGVIAFLAGCVVPIVVRWWLVLDEWSYPWIPSAYAIAFVVCICGRASAKLAVNERP
jgi:hypothetical protein